MSRRRKKKRYIPNYTKAIIFSVLITYHIGFLIGAYVVMFVDHEQLSNFLTYVGSATVFSIAFYCWKAKSENLLKIKKSLPEMEGSLSDFANINSQ